ncbi:Uncharacterized protein SCF082_LOCUS39759 [Durusdinium trenchii]|uniref:Uncharacterized protein n=1 Tax=Durusdinium trenchii TaxID=1381693 RepID=A0ABP0Q7X0_9DINO
MKLARRRAPERLDMTPMQIMTQHNMRQEKERKLTASSQDLSHLAFIGAPYWSHLARGDPYGDFQRDRLRRARRERRPHRTRRYGCQRMSASSSQAPTQQLTGTFDYLKIRAPPAYLSWRHNGPCSRVPFPEVSNLAEVTGSLRRPKSEGLITLNLQPPDAGGHRSVHHTTSSVCLGLRRNSYQRTGRL